MFTVSKNHIELKLHPSEPYTHSYKLCILATCLFTLNNGWNRKVLSSLNWTFHRKKGEPLFSAVPACGERGGQGLRRRMSQRFDSKWHGRTAALWSSAALPSVRPEHPHCLLFRPTHAHQACGWALPPNPGFPCSEEGALLPLSPFPPLWTGCGHQWCVCSWYSASVAPGSLLGARPGHLWFISVFGCCLCS